MPGLSLQTRVRFAIILMMSLSLGVFLVLPLEDLPETAFDESETQPLESTVSFSGWPLQVAVRANRPSRSLGDDLGVSSRVKGYVGHGERTPPAAHPISDFTTILDPSLRC